MLMRTRRYCFGIVILALFAYGCEEPARPTPPVHFSNKPTIIFIPQGAYDPYWNQVELGAREEAAKQEVEITWIYPSNNYDLDEQITRLESLDLKLYNGAIISPIYPSSLRASISRITNPTSGIPVVISDIPMVDDNVIGYVDANDYDAGVLAAKEIIRRLNGKGNVIMLRNRENCMKTLERERGFRASILGKGSEIKLVSSTLYAGADDTYKQAMIDVANMLKDKNQPVHAIFVSSETVGSRVISVMEDIPDSNKICFICCDPSGSLSYQMEYDKVTALIISDPQLVGAYAVEMLAKHIKGIETPKKRTVNVILSDPKMAMEMGSTDSQIPIQNYDPFPTPGVPAYDEWNSSRLPD